MTPTKDDIDRAVEGRTVAREFLTTVAAHGPRTALRWMAGEDEWSSLTFDEVAERVAQAAAGLRSLGVGHGDRVVLMMRNIPEFHWLDLAVLALGATPVSIYNSSAADQVEYLVGHCAAKVAIVENEGFLEKFLKVRDQLPSLENIVVLVAPEELPDGVHRHEVLQADPLDLAEAVAVGRPEDLATIIYTSGTTGNPKGVMISNRNVCWTLESAIHSYGWTRDEMAGKRVVSYLPMAHIAERMVSHYGMIGGGLEVATCPDPSLLTKFLGPVKPNILFGVPRVWEKVYAGLTALIAGDPDNAEKFNRAIEEISPLREKVSWGTATEQDAARCAELDAENFALVRALLGIDEVEMAVTGAAPIPAQLIRWFRAIGIPLAEVYGMSENTGPMTFERYKVKPGYVGLPLPGTELKIAEDGEVCCRGGHVFQGYLNDPEKTAETIDDDGWLHSGDIGEIDDDGYVRIVDRKKELIITAGGKNISPANLEAALKTIPLVGQAATIGDNRPFVSALVVIDLEYAPVWAAGRGIEFSSPEELAQHPEVVGEIERGVEDVMSQFNNAERVKKVRILAEEWLPDSDLLTPTSKLKRRGIHARFAEEIEAIYTS
jgi:long-chain acyl-CoA synthetase